MFLLSWAKQGLFFLSCRDLVWCDDVCLCLLQGYWALNIRDIALVQAGNAPPFIGILCKVTVKKTEEEAVEEEEQVVKFSVNWLYRLADEKEFTKGVALLEAAPPNPIFYAFHKDDNVSAACLLHACKVVFLGKGVELPSEVFSFVCCHVYNTTIKCLWWLTDCDYVNVRSFFVPTPSLSIDSPCLFIQT